MFNCNALATSSYEMEPDVCTSSDDANSDESLSEGEVEVDGSREMVLVPKKSVRSVLE